MTIGPISTFLVSPYWENVDVGKVDQCSHVLIDKAQQFPGRGSGYARLITHPSVNSFKFQFCNHTFAVSAYEPSIYYLYSKHTGGPSMYYMIARALCERWDPFACRLWHQSYSWWCPSVKLYSDVRVFATISRLSVRLAHSWYHRIGKTLMFITIVKSFYNSLCVAI